MELGNRKGKKKQVSLVEGVEGNEAGDENESRSPSRAWGLDSYRLTSDEKSRERNQLRWACFPLGSDECGPMIRWAV